MHLVAAQLLCGFAVSSSWLPNMDLNHDKQIQSLLCYHYTIRHARCGKESTRFGSAVKPSMK